MFKELWKSALGRDVPYDAYLAFLARGTLISAALLGAAIVVLFYLIFNY